MTFESLLAHYRESRRFLNFDTPLNFDLPPSFRQIFLEVVKIMERVDPLLLNDFTRTENQSELSSS